MHAGPKSGFHDGQIEFMMCAIDNNGRSRKQRSEATGLARVSKSVRHTRAAVALGDIGRRPLVVICDENFILAARLAEIANNDAPNRASATQDDETRRGLQYHPRGRSLRLI